MLWLYGLCPGLPYTILPEKYWQNLCQLVRGLRLILARELSDKDIAEVHTHLVQFVYDFENLYYQRKESRLHFVHQCIHNLVHFAPETIRVGPLALVAQWLMERTIGNLGQEICLPSDPYANLQMRAELRVQKNALKAMFPELDRASDRLPNHSLAAGSGFYLLPKKDRRLISVRHSQSSGVLTTLLDYIELNSTECSNVIPETRNVQICCYSRLRLPNGQTAQSLWGERNRQKRI